MWCFTSSQLPSDGPSHTLSRGPSCNSRLCAEHVTLAMALIVQTLPHVFWEHMPASLGLWILRGRVSCGMKIPHHFPKWVFILFLTHTASASPCPDDSISHLHSLPGTFPSGVLSYPSFCFNIFILKMYSICYLTYQKVICKHM